MLRLFGLVLTLVILLFFWEREAVQRWADWNLCNLPYLCTVYAYPLVKRGYRILRFFIYA